MANSHRFTIVLKPAVARVQTVGFAYQLAVLNNRPKQGKSRAGVDTVIVLNKIPISNLDIQPQIGCINHWTIHS